MTYLKSEKYPKWLSFPRDMMQTWRYPSFSMNTAPSQQIVSLAIDNGEITKADLELFKFLKTVKFATATQIERLFGRVDASGLNTSGYLDRLVSDRYLNSFAVSNIKTDRSWIKDTEALIVYALDFGGKYALIYDGEDMSDWYSYSNRVGVHLLGEYLLGTDIYISLMRMSLQGDLIDFESFPEWFVNNKSSETDYTFTYRMGDTDIPLVCYISETGMEGIDFAKKIRSANELLKSTKTWRKYFPLQEKSPNILVILEKLTKTTLQNTYHTIHHASKFSADNTIFTDIYKLQRYPMDSKKTTFRLIPNANKTLKAEESGIFDTSKPD